MVSNGLKYPQDVNWGEVANLPEFRGTTGAFLQLEYRVLSNITQKHYPKMKMKDISSGLVLDWHKNKKYQGKTKNKIEKEDAFIEFWTRLSSEE